MGAEKFLENQAKLQSCQASQSFSPSVCVTSFQRWSDVQEVGLREAPSLFRELLNEIIEQGTGNGTGCGDAISIPEISPLAIEDGEVKASHTVTVIGSVRVGKSSMLNSLLGVFGFRSANREIVYPDSDLLPTQREDQCGLPFPLRLEYGSNYQLEMDVWEMDGLERIMAEVAGHQDDEFWDDIDFQPPEDGSFMKFVCDYGKMVDGKYVVQSSSVEHVLQSLERRWVPPASLSTVEQYQQMHEHLKGLVQQAWFGYKLITLRCPSELLQRMKLEGKPTGIVDLPGVHVADDNNSFIEHMVHRHVREADVIILLTGQRNLKQDVLEILRQSVFERLLDCNNSHYPAVAVSNSGDLRGLKVEEMGKWNEITLAGEMGWNEPLQKFAKEVFGDRKHRSITDLKPQLFPNDLISFVSKLTAMSKKLVSDHGQHGYGRDNALTASTYPGVSTLVGYFMWLPQEKILSQLRSLLDWAKSIAGMVDSLWQVPEDALNLLIPPESSREAKKLRDEEFAKTVDARLTMTFLKTMFAFENADTEKVETIFSKEWIKLEGDLQKGKEDISELLIVALRRCGLQWDTEVGQPAFKRFLVAAQNLAKELVGTWVDNAFITSRRSKFKSNSEDSMSLAHKTIRKNAEDAVAENINDSRFMYTFTRAFQQQVRNLAGGQGRKNLRKSGNAEVQRVFFSKKVVLDKQMQSHMQLQSIPVKKLLTLLKTEIAKSFRTYMENFVQVQKLLQRVLDNPGSVSAVGSRVAGFRKDIGQFVSSLQRYIANHCKRRDRFGEQELDRIIQSRCGNAQKRRKQQP